MHTRSRLVRATAPPSQDQCRPGYRDPPGTPGQARIIGELRCGKAYIRMGTVHNSSAADCRRGDVVRVRSREEILATLDADGAAGGLPFMPEMLAYCGRELPVYARADKTCDTIEMTGTKRCMSATVHLTGARCDGSAH